MLKKMPTPNLDLPELDQVVYAHSREHGECVVAVSSGTAYVITLEVRSFSFALLSFSHCQHTVVGSFPMRSKLRSLASSLHSSQLWSAAGATLLRWYL